MIKQQDVKAKPLEYSGFSCCAYTEKNEIKIRANVNYSQADGLSFSFSEPESCKLIKGTCSVEEIYLQMGKSEVTVPRDKMPDDSIISALAAVTERVNNVEVLRDKDGEPFKFDFSRNNHRYVVYLNSDADAFVKLTIDGRDRIFFENFSFTD